MIGAAVARGLGYEAVAASAGEVRALPEEVPTVLAEIGLDAPSAVKLDEALMSGAAVVWLGDTSAPIAAERTIACALLDESAAQIARLAAARIARDRIERALEMTQTLEGC